MANYVIPVFNVNVAFWRFGTSIANPPDVLALGNLSPGKIVSGDKGSDASPIGQSMWLRLPKGTDAQDLKNGVGPDTCECPYTSGRFYVVEIVDDIGGGFANEHRFAVLGGVGTWPTPFPTVGGFTPIVPPVPPSFFSAYSTFPGGGGPITLNIMSTGGAISGCHCAVNDLGLPTVTVNGGANCLRNGAGADIAFAPLGQPSVNLYPWDDVGIVGLNTVVITPAGIPPKLYIGFAGHGMGPSNVLTYEGAQSNFGGPPTFPPYAPNPAHPKVHMAYAIVMNPTGVIGWNAPFSIYGAVSPVTVGLTTLQLMGGTYLAGIGGQFPAHATGPSGAWAAIQHSYVP